MDSILSEYSDKNDNEKVKTVCYIRRNRHDKSDFADILLKEQLRLERMADEILEDYKQKK